MRKSRKPILYITSEAVWMHVIEGMREGMRECFEKPTLTEREPFGVMPGKIVKVSMPPPRKRAVRR